MAKKKKFYGVATGKVPGVYTQWFGNDGAKAQVDGFNGALYKGFLTRPEAEAFVKKNAGKKWSPKKTSRAVRDAEKTPPVLSEHFLDSDRIVIYTDGCSLGNPGPGGYGAVIPGKDAVTELSEGFRLTTNNRMELLACIKGLDFLEKPSRVTLYSDSRYVVDGITKGWAANWKRNRWRKSNKQPALNPDLWDQLLLLCEKHDVRFCWVKGHAGNPGNERCDRLANDAAMKKNLPEDKGYKSYR